LQAFSGVDTRAPGIKSELAYLPHPCHLGALGLFSHLTATTVVVGSLATVPPGDRFLSPVPDGQGSYERGSRSMLVYRLELFSA